MALGNNFKEGYDFSAALGYKTGDQLENMLKLCALEDNDAGDNRLYDNVYIGLDKSKTLGPELYLTVLPGSITSDRLNPNLMWTQQQTQYFKAYANTQDQVLDNVWTPISMDTKVHDVNGAFDTGTFRYTPKIPGIYQVTATVTISDQDSDDPFQAGLFLNGSLAQKGSYSRGDQDQVEEWFNPASVVVWTGEMDGATDYFDVRAMVNGTVGGENTIIGEVYTNFSGFRLAEVSP